MNLLKNYIGIRGIGTEPDSGIYINQLPGINLKSIQGIADSEQVTFSKVWDDLQVRAGMRLGRELRVKLKNKFRIKSNRGIYNIAAVDKGKVLSAETKYKGAIYESGLDRNGFFAFLVHTISVDLIANLNAPLIVKVFDILGVQLDSFTIASPAAGINNIKVNKEYNTPKVFIAVDSTGISLKETVIVDADSEAWRYGITNAFGCGCQPLAYGATASLDNACITQMVGNTGGISATISPVCSYNSLIANNKELVADAWLYLLGAELMIERMYSSRINKFTTVDSEDAQNLCDLFTGQYEEAINDFIGGVEISAEDGCIECRETITVKETLP